MRHQLLGRAPRNEAKFVYCIGVRQSSIPFTMPDDTGGHAREGRRLCRVGYAILPSARIIDCDLLAQFFVAKLRPYFA